MIGLVGVQAGLTLFAAVTTAGQKNKNSIDQKVTQAVTVESKQSANEKENPKSDKKHAIKEKADVNNKDVVPTPEATVLPATQAGKMTKRQTIRNIRIPVSAGVCLCMQTIQHRAEMCQKGYL